MLNFDEKFTTCRNRLNVFAEKNKVLECTEVR